MVMSGQHWHDLAGYMRSRDKDSKDMSRATLGQSTNRDIPIPRVAIRVLAFKSFGV